MASYSATLPQVADDAGWEDLARERQRANERWAVSQAPHPRLAWTSSQLGHRIADTRPTTAMEEMRRPPSWGATADSMLRDRHERQALQHRRAHWSHARGGSAPVRDDHLPPRLLLSEACKPMKMSTAPERWASTPHKRLA